MFRLKDEGHYTFILKKLRTESRNYTRKGVLSSSLTKQEQKTPSGIQSRIEAVIKALPDPAPVYSQWWFCQATYCSLMSLLRSCQAKGTETAFLGAPSLAAVFSHLSKARVTVLDVDSEVLRSLRTHFFKGTDAICYDVGDELDRELLGRFGFVVADPPWGRALLPKFLWRCNELVRNGGIVIISIPQFLTRPGVLNERRSLLYQASQWGMMLDRMVVGATHYQVPPFEHQAYLASGIVLDKPWRQGDLWVFRKGGRVSRAEPPLPFESSPCWDQFSIEKQRLFLLQATCDEREREPGIHPLPGATGYINPTTSSRNELMRHASLITTQNGFATTSGTTELRCALPLCLKMLRDRQTISSLLGRYHTSTDILRELESVLDVVLNRKESPQNGKRRDM